MSNETDLDWLARNVHVWREGANYVCVNHTDGGYVFHEHNRNCAIRFTKDQWLARRAELQNKPGWGDHPDAKCLFQHESGRWFKNIESSDMGADGIGWRNNQLSRRVDCGWVVICQGEVLGDWRDTLERRPEKTRAEDEADLVSAVAEVFKPFASIEDNQERDMKQDNGWFERGELPPVGVFCEAYIDRPPQWIEAEIVAHKDGFAIGWCKSVMNGCHGDKASEFRPIRTERDVLMSVLECYSGALPKEYQRSEVADAILAAGFKLEAK